MTRPSPGTLLRVLAPVLAGAALGGALQAAEPDARVYAAASPSLLAGLAGLLATGILAGVTLVRQRVAAAAAAASDAASRGAEAKAAQDRLRFLMRLDHELKNPLTAIRAGLVNIDFLASSAQARAVPAARGGISETLASVWAQADRINKLVSDLRKLADLETQEIEAAPVDLPGLLHEVVEAVGEIPTAGERAIRVTVPRAPWPLPLIEGDRDLLFIAMQNLVANAVKFSAPGDTIEVRASEDDDALLLEVADTGVGIPADEIGQVWQELARGRIARSLPGTGIGLALVRVIAARHGGQVAIRSRHGQGTVVSIRLPVPDRARTAPGVASLRQHRDTPGKAPV
jgi:two-component system OmpR family sensor kinase